MYTAQEMRSWGVVNHIVAPGGDVVEETLKWAVELAENSPDSVIVSRAGLLGGWDPLDPAKSTQEIDEGIYKLLDGGENQKEGVQSFVEKRLPLVWVTHNVTNPQPVSLRPLEFFNRHIAATMPVPTIFYLFEHGPPQWLRDWAVPITVAVTALTLLYFVKRYTSGSTYETNKNMHGKVVMMTGATSGIGAEVGL
ncbi:hypothetical protein NLG97_g3412 [Lecanicillium saksenae]|uniref:Uncharacterized protein n=1 Tax=Lecanicillium saksenae TaxID=468837 RepID=A0ACC1QYC8_9HYPO|nr:hypothetical protein NLG97_g3412 [Lecanicillium saksenae]